MAQFSLKQTVNRTNNPSIDGIFEYGMFDPVTLEFTPFDAYGYTDGSPVNYNNLDFAKILGWYKSNVGDYPHLAFEHIQGNSNITPQPFPNQGVYIHPAVSWVQGVNANVGVRIHILSPATFQILTGSTIESADNNCGDNINYRVRKNSTDLIPNTVIAHGSGQHAITTTVTSVTTGDKIDIMTGVGNSGDNPFCDDTALEALIEIIPTKVNTPTVDMFSCSDTDVTAHVSLQTEGTVEMYNSSDVLIGTGTIIPDGYNGITTITNLDLSEGGSFYFIAKNSGQVDSERTSVITIASCCTPVTITTQPTGYSICDSSPTPLSVVATGTATISYQWYKDNVLINGAILPTYTPSVSGNYKVELENECGDVMSNEVTVTIYSSPLVASGATIPDAVTLSAYNHSIILSGTEPFTLSNIVKPAWMSISLANNIVSLSGTPALIDAGNDLTVSFTVTGKCTALDFDDVINVVSTCTTVTGGIISGNTNVIAGINETYNLVGLTGTTPYNILWGGTGGVVVISGQGTTTASITRTSSGTVTATITNCAGIGSITLTFNVIVVTADAVNDAVGNKVTGIATNSQISNNDIVCNVGATTYELVTGSESNVIVNSIDPITGIANYTPTADGGFSFNYVIKCNGGILDTATISGTGYTPCVPINVTISSNKYPVSNGLVTYTASPLITGTWAITGGAVIQSGQGTGVVKIKYPSVPYIADLTFQYMTCGNIAVVTKKVYMSLPPCCEDCCSTGCC